MFDQMISSLTAGATAEEIKTISLDEYKQWQELYTWDAIQDLRYGQSFCNHFNITDHRLFYERDWVRCDQMIRREYIERPRA
jgi:hypothetical protein